MSIPSYGAVAYSHQAANQTTGPGLAIDIGNWVVEGFPPVMHVTAADYVSEQDLVLNIEGSHDAHEWVVYGTYTMTSPVTALKKDLIPGVRFWRTNITTNPTTVSSSVGAFPTGSGGGWFTPTNYIVENNATEGM